MSAGMMATTGTAVGMIRRERRRKVRKLRSQSAKMMTREAEETTEKRAGGREAIVMQK
jgi:hypothetical protein